jgi:hypothetical protein
MNKNSDKFEQPKDKVLVPVFFKCDKCKEENYFKVPNFTFKLSDYKDCFFTGRILFGCKKCNNVSLVKLISMSDKQSII